MANIVVHVRAAFRQLRTYPVESALIIIALAVGVGALSAVATLYGVNDEIAKRIRADITSRRFTIMPATSDDFANLSSENLILPVRQNQPTNMRFTLADLEAIKELAPGVDHIYYRIERQWFPASWSRTSGLGMAMAVTSDYTDLAGIEVARGSWFSQEDFDLGRRVVVLTERHLAELGIEGDPIGREIPMNYADMGGAPFTIVGVLPPGHEVASTSSGGFPVVGYVPFTETTPSVFLYAAVDDPRRLEAAGEELRLAAERHWGDQVVVRAPTSLWQASAAERTRTLFLAGFASVGLLMASLNITNLMLARVRRRARAISIQRSLGATTRFIRTQILTEAAVLGLIGGALGVALSQVLLGALLASAAPGVAELLETVSFPLSSVVVTLIASVVVTMIIGLVPAARAAGTQIIPSATSAVDLAPGLPKPLRRNPARLVLTTLQLVISGAAIVVGLHVLSLGNSVKPDVSVFTIEARGGPADNARVILPVFKPQDLPELLELAPAIDGLTTHDFSRFSYAYAVVDDHEYVIAGVRQVGPEYMAMADAELVAGSPLTGTADPRMQSELLLERSVAEHVFGSADAAVDGSITLRGRYADSRDPFGEQEYTVVGVYAYEDPGHAYGTPEKAAALANPPNDGSSGLMAIAPRDRAPEAMAELTAAARARYGSRFTSIGATYDLHFSTNELWSHDQLERTLNQAMFIFTLMAITAIILAAVGSFSLSILNTAERTTDIGVRRALGASRSQVAREIAGSAALIATIATLAGIGVAWLASPSLSASLSDSLLSGIQVPVHTSLALVTLGLVLLTSGFLGWLVGFRATRAAPSSVLSEEGT